MFRDEFNSFLHDIQVKNVSSRQKASCCEHFAGSGERRQPLRE